MIMLLHRHNSTNWVEILIVYVFFFFFYSTRFCVTTVGIARG